MYIVIKAFVVWLIFYSINATLNGLEARGVLGGGDCNAKIKAAKPTLLVTEQAFVDLGGYIKQNHMQYF